MGDLCVLCDQPLDLVEMFCETLEDVGAPRYCDDCLQEMDDRNVES